MEVYLHKALQNNSEFMKFIKIISSNQVDFFKRTVVFIPLQF